MLGTEAVLELASKRARLAAEIAAIDEHLKAHGAEDVEEGRPLKQAKTVSGPPKTCVACLDVITNGTYLFTCQRSIDQVLCAACVPAALESVATESSTLMTEKGLCLTHMSSTCSRTTGSGLIDYASQYITADLRSRLMLKLSHTAHTKCTVTRPLSCMALCPSCGDTASLDIPKSLFNDSPFIICRRCPLQPPWCLNCHRNVGGPFFEREKKRPKAALHFSFVNVIATVACRNGVPQGVLPNGPLEHKQCTSLTCLNTIIETVRDTVVKPALAITHSNVPEKPVPFPSHDVEVFYAWALSKHKPMSGFEACHFAEDKLPSAMELLSTVRHMFHPSLPDAALRRSLSKRVLTILFERALSQRCRTCGKAGVKDLSCTHIACCGKTWCYVCEDFVLKKKGMHPCPMTLQRGGLDGGGNALGAAEAVEWFHIAKLACYARSWMQANGIAAGLATLLSHELWRPFIAQHACKLFTTDVEKRWFATVRVNVDVQRECCF